MGLIKTLKAKLFKSTPLINFPYRPKNPKITNGSEDFHAYPQKYFLGNEGAYAYYLTLVIQMDQAPILLNFLKTKFNTTSLTQQKSTTPNQETIIIDSRLEFGGLLIEITTNPIESLQYIDRTFHSPPPPWIAFPHIDPIEITLPKQGSLEYWFNHIWEPYWSNQSDENKTTLLTGAPLGWKEELIN